MYESKERVFQSRKTRPLVLFYYACRKQAESDRERCIKRREAAERTFSRGPFCICICIFRFGSDISYGFSLLATVTTASWFKAERFVDSLSSCRRRFCRWFPFVHADKARSWLDSRLGLQSKPKNRTRLMENKQTNKAHILFAAH